MHACTQAAGQWSPLHAHRQQDSGVRPRASSQQQQCTCMHGKLCTAHKYIHLVLRTLFPAAWEACEHACALTPPAAGAHCVKQQCVHQLTRVHCTKLTWNPCLLISVMQPSCTGTGNLSLVQSGGHYSSSQEQQATQPWWTSHHEERPGTLAGHASSAASQPDQRHSNFVNLGLDSAQLHYRQ